MKRNNWVYRIVRFGVKLCYPKTEVAGLHNLPEEPCIIVANHAKMNGPITGVLFFPEPCYIWCAAEMMELKEVPAYAYKDFWSRKPKYIRWFYKLLSYIIAPLSVGVFNGAPTIGVYHDKRVVSTFKNTVVRLKEGANVIIFPEHDAPRNQIVCDFQEGFVDIARTYYRQTGKELKFVPMYLAPALHKMCLGEPVSFCPENPVKEERKRICEYLMKNITELAYGLPRHRVVPYNNILKKQYPYNKE